MKSNLNVKICALDKQDLYLRWLKASLSNPPKMKSYVRLSTGETFDFLDNSAGEISIEAVAHSLAGQNRFTGHLVDRNGDPIFYSVAQHSVAVSWLVHPMYTLTALMHDSAESVLGDVATPLKQLLYDYQALECEVEASFAAAFGFMFPLPPEVKVADRIMLRTEQRDLMPHDGLTPSEDWDMNVEPLTEVIVPMNSKDAKAAFLKRYYELA